MGEVLEIFISATSADLGAVRTAAKNALLTLGYLPIEQEHFGPAPETILEMLRRRIRGKRRRPAHRRRVPWRRAAGRRGAR